MGGGVGMLGMVIGRPLPPLVEVGALGVGVGCVLDPLPGGDGIACGAVEVGVVGETTLVPRGGGVLLGLLTLPPVELVRVEIVLLAVRLGRGIALSLGRLA